MAELTGQRITQAQVSACDLSGAAVSGCDLSGAAVVGSDLRGVRVRDADLRGLTAVDCYLQGVVLAGEIDGLVVNDVDVTDFVNAELDRREPLRVQRRAATTLADLGELWSALEQRWAEAVARAERLSDMAREEQVAGEWSFAQTLRHLVFATDGWLGRAVREEPAPFHPLGLPHAGYGAERTAALGLAPDERPSWGQVLEARASRQALVRDLLGGLTEAELDRPTTLAPAPGYPDDPHTVRQCLGVVVEEEVEHLRYAERDLAVLEAREPLEARS